MTAAVEQSQQLPSALPEKAINVLDTACARVRLQVTQPPKEISELRYEIERIKVEKDLAISNDQFDRAAELRDRQLALQRQLAQKEDAWRDPLSNEQPTVTAETVAQVVVEGVHWFIGSWVHGGLVVLRGFSELMLPAIEEAIRLGAPEVDTEHLLLGLLRQGGVAAQVLKQMGINADDVRMAVERQLPASSSEPAAVTLSAVNGRPKK